jgi:hypothetical protein
MAIFSCQNSLLVGFITLAGLLPASVVAQIIKPDKGGQSCEVTEKCDKHKYEFIPDPDQFFQFWEVRGDAKLLTPPPDNPAVICSEGYGKARITAHYYTLSWRRRERCPSECPDTLYHTLDYDLYKRFSPPNPIQGPACVVPGTDVTYSVPPILTDWPHRAAGIGTDSYFWSGFPPDAILRFSGDSSSVTVTLPADLSTDFTPTVQVGRCNADFSQQLTVTLAQALATAVSVPTCRPTNATTPATLTIATVAGVTYTVSLPSGWSFTGGFTGTLTGDGNPHTVAFLTDANAGDVVIRSDGGCGGPQVVARRVTRQLSALNQLQVASCLTRNVPVTVTLSPAPAQSHFYWTVPSGWPVDLTFNGATLVSTTTYRTTAPAIRLTPRGNGGTIRVNSGDAQSACVAPVPVERLLTITGGRGCGPFELVRLGLTGRAFALTILGAPTPTPCLPDGNGAPGSGVVYTWTATPTIGGAPTTQTLTSDYNERSFGGPVAAGSALTVRVQQLTPGICLDTTLTFTVPASRPGRAAREARTLTGTPDLTEYGSYPNPADQELTLALPATAAAPVTVVLTDALGRVALRRSVTESSSVLRVGALTSGLYTLRATYPTGPPLTQRVRIEH